MLDSQIITQLKEVFLKLNRDIALVYDQSTHSKQSELVQMLEDIATTSPRIKIQQSDKSADIPGFRIFKDNRPSGISFLGIPGGHEFSSLILAILNTSGAGKMPDSGIIQRVQALKGPIKIRTYVSLECENCPDVVQALNLMSSLHDHFEHQMIDGAFVQEEITNLGIQGVPSVMHDKTLLSSGKNAFIDLLIKLEEHFGTQKSFNEPKDLGDYDVVVVGGGPAGASSAIYSARKGLKTAIIAERLGGQVKDTKGIENLISIPYTEGPALAAELARHMGQYEIDFYEHRKVSKVEGNETKKLFLDSGETLETKSLIVATGAKWRELGIPGERENIGRGVAFCPHCDGPFYKGKNVAVVGGGNSGVEAAIDLSGIVNSVVLFEFLPELKADRVLVDKLKSLSNVTIVTNAKTTKVVDNGSKVIGIEFEDRNSGEIHRRDLDGIFVQIGLMPNSQFIKDQVETNKFGEIHVDVKGRTSAPGIYAAGDVTTVPYKQIIIAMGEGAKAALTAFEDLKMGR